MKQLINKRVLVVSTLWTFCAPTFAEINHSNHVEEVVVSAAGGQKIQDVLQSVAVLNGQSLDAYKGASLGDTVAHVAGVNNAAFGQAVGRPVIHGMGGARVMLTQSSMASSDVSTLSQDHAVSIEPFLAQQIEILKGPATLRYGAGAIGGIVNVETGRIPEKALEGNFEGRYESSYSSVSNGQAHMFMLNAGNESFVVHVDALHRRNKDYKTPASRGAEDGMQALDGKLPNSWTHADAGAIGASWLGDWGFVGASVSRYMNEYGLPAEETVHLGMAQTRYAIKAGFNQPIKGIDKIRIDLEQTDYHHTEFDAGQRGTRFENQSKQGRFVIDHDAILGWQGSVGVQAFTRDFQALDGESFVPETRTENLGLFVIERYQFSQVDIELGARVDRQSSNPDGAKKRQFTPKNASIALAWQVQEPLKLSLNVDRSQRAPSEEELFAYGDHEGSHLFELGDANLSMETSHQLALGLQYLHKVVDVNVSLYANVFDNFIYLSETNHKHNVGLPDESEFNQANWQQGKARFYGADIELLFHLADNASGLWDLRSTSDVVRAYLINAGNVPRIPAARTGLSLIWQKDNWQASVTAQHYFKQNKTALNESQTGAFTLLNANVSWDFYNGSVMRWQAFVKANNLTNQTARLATSLFKDEAPLAGRDFSLGIRAWF